MNEIYRFKTAPIFMLLLRDVSVVLSLDIKYASSFTLDLESGDCMEQNTASSKQTNMERVKTKESTSLAFPLVVRHDAPQDAMSEQMNAYC